MARSRSNKEAQAQGDRDYAEMTRRAEAKHGAGTGASLVRYHRKKVEGTQPSGHEKAAEQYVRDTSN